MNPVITTQDIVTGLAAFWIFLLTCWSVCFLSALFRVQARLRLLRMTFGRRHRERRLAKVMNWSTAWDRLRR